MRLAFFILVFVLSHCPAIKGQSGINMQPQIDSLKALYGNHKVLPAGFESPALTALSYFPELKNKHIRFVFKKADLPYTSRPQYYTLLPFFKKRYVITISTQSTALREPTLLHHLSLDAQTGALGHELSHVSWYTAHSKWQIINAGLRYHQPAFKEQFEKMTDRIAIEHGLGPLLYIWCSAIYPIKKQDGMRAKFYYSPEEIRALWHQQSPGQIKG